MKCRRCKHKKDYEYAASVCKHDGNIKIEYINGSRKVVMQPIEDIHEKCPYFHETLLFKLDTWYVERRIRKLQKKFPENFL